MTNLAVVNEDALAKNTLLKRAKLRAKKTAPKVPAEPLRRRAVKDVKAYVAEEKEDVNPVEGWKLSRSLAKA